MQQDRFSGRILRLVLYRIHCNIKVLASKPKFELGSFLWDSQSVLVWPDECRDGEVLEFPNQDPNMETLILMN